jgi:hypothetical protein
MRTGIRAILVVLLSVSAFAAKCTLGEHAEYNKKIREYTTAPSFLTELVDHVPLSSCVPAPDAYLKHIAGAPDVLTYTGDIYAYMRLLESKSPRVKVFALGKSEEGREMLLVAISDEPTIAALDRYKQINARLADPRGLNDDEARVLIAQGKPMYWAAGSIHSTETGAPEMMMELAYRLAVEESPFIQTIRKNSIVLLTPVLEVDGRDRYVDLYMYKKHHPEETPRRLVWWGHYVAHDNNRDALTASLALTQNVLRGFLDWHPQVLHDLHESVPYLYISTGTGPYNAWLDPITTTEWNQMAFYEVQEMTKRGVIGVWTYGYGDGWGPHVLRFIGNGHNAIGRLYETFGNGGADTRVRTLGPQQTSREWYRQSPPLAKVAWSMRNNVNMQQSALLFGMYNLAINRERFLTDFWLKSKRSVAKARQEGPAAWVFPADDPRPVEQARLLNLLRTQGLEIQRATQDIKAGDKTFAAGSYVVRMDQPYSRMADMMLDTQYYNPRDPRPYDETGWTLGALRNVRTVRVTDAAVLDAPMEKLAGEVHARGGGVGSGSTYLINHNTDNTLATLRFRLASVGMDAAERAFDADGVKYSAGTFIIRNLGSETRAALEQAANELGLTVHATDAAISVPTHPLRAPRVALVHNWVSTQDDGWFRLAMDRLKIPYTYVADTRLREMANIRQQFDVLILPPMSGNLSAILKGVPARGSVIPWKNTPETPNLDAPGLDTADDIRGGLGYSGLASLERFLSDGGLLLAIASSAALPVQGGMTEMVSIGEPRQLYAPGTVVNAAIDDHTSPIAYGYADKLAVYYRMGPIFRVGASLGGRGEEGPAPGGRGSGRGSVNDPDVVQARPYIAPEKAPKRTRAEEELNIPEGMEEMARTSLPPRNEWPRVILRFAPERELLNSGLLTGGAELAERPAVVDVPHGKGHVVLFANNPMWRDETMGSFFLVFNAMLNFDSLDAGRAPAPQQAAGR